MKQISYLNKDFSSFKQNLINFAKTYYKQTLNDFDESDPAMMFIEMSAYVGDVLSYYLDSQLKEMLLLYASERSSVVELAQALGYKPRPTIPAITTLDVYQVVPSIGTGLNNKPDLRYGLIIKPGMQIGVEGNGSLLFRSTAEVNFQVSGSYDPLEISIYSIQSNEPNYYLLKKSTKIESGTQKTIDFTFTTAERYKKITIEDTNVISIDNVVDSAGNIWYEVPYLSQDTVFAQQQNSIANEPYLLKLQKVSKRFITKYNADNTLTIQFGSGVVSNRDEEITPNPDNVGLMTPGGMHKLNDSWDVANFMFTDAYGESPANTKLTITYTVGGGIKSNALSNTINLIKSIDYSNDTSVLDQNVFTLVKNSVAVTNPSAATGGKDFETIDEIRHNALAYFAAQGRAVTKDDYLIRALSMPAKYGSISKSHIEQSKSSSELNLYVLSYDANKKLVRTSDLIKRNLSVYLDKYRVMTDTIVLRDAYIVNFGISYDLYVSPGFNANEISLNSILLLKDFFNIDNWQINQPIIIADIYKLLATSTGVQNVTNIQFTNLFDIYSGYAPTVYDLASATRNNVIYPSIDPCIFEIKYPDVDIKCRVL